MRSAPSPRDCSRVKKGERQPTTKLHLDFRWKQQHFCLVGRHLQYRDHIKVRTVRGYPFLPGHAGVPQDLQDEPSAMFELSNAAIETHPASVDEDGRPRGICRPLVRRTGGRSLFVGFVQTSASSCSLRTNRSGLGSSVLCVAQPASMERRAGGRGRGARGERVIGAQRVGERARMGGNGCHGAMHRREGRERRDADE